MLRPRFRTTSELTYLAYGEPLTNSIADTPSAHVYDPATAGLYRGKDQPWRELPARHFDTWKWLNTITETSFTCIYVRSRPVFTAVKTNLKASFWGDG
ncbi:Uncharacterised protein [Mycobacteroides abscessus subsp. abscessus]|nr:Uncharacterised protein [Mycobacteroides abscessus subsp. abscessus]